MRMAYNAAHIPFRDWCPIFVASRGRSSPHRRVVVNKTTDTLPKFQTDYMFIRTVTESKIQPWRSGVVISFMCVRRGGCEDLTKEILWYFEVYGFLDPVIIQCDKEMISTTCVEQLHENETREQCYDSRQKQVIRATGLSKQCKDTCLDSHDATRHKLSRTLAYNFQQFHFPYQIQLVTLDLFSQDSQCDPAAEHHSNICLELHMHHLCACLVNRYSLWFRSRSACSQTDEQVDQWFFVGTRCIVRRTPGGDETWFAWVQSAENHLESNGVDVKRSKFEARSGSLTWKWILEHPDQLWNSVEMWECRQQRHRWKFLQHLHLYFRMKNKYP